MVIVTGQQCMSLTVHIGYTPTWRDYSYLEPEGEARGVPNSCNPDKEVCNRFKLTVK